MHLDDIFINTLSYNYFKKLTKIIICKLKFDKLVILKGFYQHLDINSQFIIIYVQYHSSFK